MQFAHAQHSKHDHDYIDSYYSRTLKTTTQFPVLNETITTPVCVIGGGMAGVATAQGLVDRGINPVLLEAKQIGFGASGRNGGFVSSGYSADISKIVKTVGITHARELYELTQNALNLIRKRSNDRFSEQVDESTGILYVSWFNQRQATEEYLAFMKESMGVEYEFWPREKIQEDYLTERYYDGYRKPDGFLIHSLNYTRHSAQQAQEGGALIYENSPATKIQKHANGWKVITDKGCVIADQIVVCCSAYIGELNFRLANATLAVATYIMLTEPLGERLKTAIRGPYGVSDNRFSSNYYRTLGDGRLFWGGRVSMFNPTGDRLKAIMMNDLLLVYPQLRGIKAELAWGGYMGYPVHKMPQIGELETGFWYAQGFGGSGMTATVAGGEVVAGAIANGDETYQLFEPFGLQYAGKPFGPIVAQTAYWLFQLQDAYKAWRLNR